MPKEQLKDKNSDLIKIFDPKELLGHFNKLFLLIIGAMLIGFITMLFMVAGIVIEAWRFNSTVYKEYSQSNLLEVNKSLTETNKQNQELILKNQKEIEKLIKELDEKQI